MTNIKTEGLTIFTVNNIYRCSVVSRRGAALALEKSCAGEWDSPVIAYVEPINIGGFLLVGFQPDTGRHLAISAKQIDSIIRINFRFADIDN